MTNTPPRKRDDKSGLLLIALGVLLALGSLAYFITMNKNDTPASSPSFNKADASTSAPTQDQAQPGPLTEVDISKALSPRTLGADTAPIKIHEYASLSCSHCANFHSNVLPKIKTSHVETGKVQFIFVDFPLNKSALEASLLARCLPKEQYTPFIEELFSTQNTWAFVENSTEVLKTAAAAFGLPETRANACLDSKPLKNALIKDMHAAARQWQVSATPSFLINNKTLISGINDSEEFLARMEDALKTAAEQDQQ